MSDPNGNPFGPMLTAFLVGAALGAIVVALTTPKTGEQLREDLGDLFDRLKGQDLGDLLDRLKGLGGEDKSSA